MSKFFFGGYFVLFGRVFCNVFAPFAALASLPGSGRYGAPPSSSAHFAHFAKSCKISATKNKISPKTNLSSNGNTVILIIFEEV